MVDWLIATLRQFPELAIFVALAAGFWVGPKKVGGFNLGNVTATLLAAVAIGQLGIEIPGPIKSTFFMLFLFAVGYGVGPQFFAGLGKDGPKQILFSVLVLFLCLLVPFVCAKIAGLDVGYTAGLFAGSQTTSAAIGVASDQISRLGVPGSQAKAWSDAIPIGYAVTYIFGTIGSAIILAQLGPKMIGVDLAKACVEYEAAMGAVEGQDAGVFSAYSRVVVRAYRIEPGELTGKPVSELFPGMRIFIERVRRNDEMIEAEASTILEAGDIVAISGPRALLVERVETVAVEVEDPQVLDFDVEKVDVFVRSKQFSGLTLRQLADTPEARGIYLSKITRNLLDIPILPETEMLRGDLLTVAGRRSHVNAFAKAGGYADRPVEATDLMVVAAGIVVGALVGALSIRIGGIPIGLSTSGGALLAGLILGYLRAVHPTFGGIPVRRCGFSIRLVSTCSLRSSASTPRRVSWQGCSKSASACCCGVRSPHPFRWSSRCCLAILFSNSILRFCSAYARG